MKSDNFSKKLIVVLALFAAQVFSQNSFTDTRDGKKYKAVKIGEQVWMAENLNYNAEGSKCYANNEAHCKTYGRLYNLETAEIVCPAGWHLPNDDEWKKLLRFAGEGNIAGTKLKAKKGWNSDGNGTDDFDFSALPCGYGIQTLGSFYHLGEIGYWWSATENNKGGAYYRFMLYESDIAGWNSNSKDLLLSVRCLQD